MAPRKSPLSDAFVRSPAAKRVAGRPCSTCRSQHRAAVEAECAAYNRARRAGKALASWEAFHRILRKGLGYEVRDYKSLVRHMKECLGWEVT